MQIIVAQIVHYNEYKMYTSVIFYEKFILYRMSLVYAYMKIRCTFTYR